jgi:hypothetical protein
MGLYGGGGGGGYVEPPPVPYKDSGEFFNYKTQLLKEKNDSVKYGKISYDPISKKWDILPEKIDYKIDYPVANYTKTLTKTRYVQEYEKMKMEILSVLHI